MKLNTSKGRTDLSPLVLFVLVFLAALSASLYLRLAPELRRTNPANPAFHLTPAMELASLPTAQRFDFPMGTENGAFSYNAQPFTENRHLGDDLNGIGGENSDLGDPIYAIADGRVLLAQQAGPGWGNVIIVLHAYEERGKRRYVQSFYGHVRTMLVESQQDVRRGQQIAMVGNANGRYLAHLHFEMREFVAPFIGPGYRSDTRGWVDPTHFIRRHRGAPEEAVGRGAQVP
ncbi:hypothetical protein BH18VER1_BH18VER1_09770 [soil metagenome]